jgi:hypothetical protein
VHFRPVRLFQDSLPLKILNDLPCCKFRGNPLTVWALGGKVDPEQRAANPSAQFLPDDSEECANDWLLKNTTRFGLAPATRRDDVGFSLQRSK